MKKLLSSSLKYLPNEKGHGNFSFNLTTTPDFCLFTETGSNKFAK